MSTATLLTGVVVTALAAMLTACLSAIGAFDGTMVAGANELEAGRSAACLLTIF